MPSCLLLIHVIQQQTNCTSDNLLCRRSSIRSLVSADSVSGRLCSEFSLSASVCKDVRLPSSAGSDTNLLPYKNNSVSLVSCHTHRHTCSVFTGDRWLLTAVNNDSKWHVNTIHSSGSVKCLTSPMQPGSVVICTQHMQQTSYEYTQHITTLHFMCCTHTAPYTVYFN